MTHREHRTLQGASKQGTPGGGVPTCGAHARASKHEHSRARGGWDHGSGSQPDTGFILSDGEEAKRMLCFETVDRMLSSRQACPACTELDGPCGHFDELVWLFPNEAHSAALDDGIVGGRRPLPDTNHAPKPWPQWMRWCPSHETLILIYVTYASCASCKAHHMVRPLRMRPHA